MNERIKYLAKQSGLSYLYDYDADGHAMVCSESDIKKLAELIVRECLNLCSEVKKDLEVVPDKLEREATEMGVTFCYEAIKGEFGVEE